MWYVHRKSSIYFNIFGQCLRRRSVTSRFGTPALIRLIRSMSAVDIGRLGSRRIRIFRDVPDGDIDRTHHASCSFFRM